MIMDTDTPTRFLEFITQISTNSLASGVIVALFVYSLPKAFSVFSNEKTRLRIRDIKLLAEVDDFLGESNSEIYSSQMRKAISDSRYFSKISTDHNPKDEATFFQKLSFWELLSATLLPFIFGLMALGTQGIQSITFLLAAIIAAHTSLIIAKLTAHKLPSSYWKLLILILMSFVIFGLCLSFAANLAGLDETFTPK